MIVEINYLTVALVAAIVSALAGAFWAMSRAFLAQYGRMLHEQLAAHRSAESRASEAIVRRLDGLEAELETRMAEHAARINRLEGVTAKAPTHDDLGKLYEKQNETARSVAQLVGEVKGMGDTLRLILNQIAHKGMQ